MDPLLEHPVLTVSLTAATFGEDGRPAKARGLAASRGFVAGPENQIAAFAVQELLRSSELDPSELSTVALDFSGAESCLPTSALAYNPLVLYGPPGTGKSHLALGLAHQWSRRRPQDKVVCVTAADFASGYADSIENQTTSAWRTRYRQANFLVIEDLGQLSNKTAAQLELVRALDTLAEKQAQVVVTARLAPAQLSSLHPSLVSRLAAGLCVPLTAPGAEARVALLQRLAAERRLTITAEAVQILAAALPVTVPELSGTLVSLETEAHHDRGSIDGDRAREFIARRDNPLAPTLHHIAVQTARHFGLKVSELRSPSRKQTTVLARGVAMHLARQLTEKSLQEVGKYFGGRDHTTVLHGCRKTEGLLQTDLTTRHAFDQLRQALTSLS
jgi:chromosomal replication initiator protein